MKRFFILIRHPFNSVTSLALSYIGINDGKKMSRFVIDVVLGPVWETLVFQGVLLGLPFHFIMKTWDIAWLPDPAFDRLIKVTLSICVVVFSIFSFVTFHRPGHFGTFFLGLKAGRLLRKMEGAWVWKKYEQAALLASELLPVAEELWVREGRNYPRFLQALSCYVLVHCGTQITPERARQLNRTLTSILEEVPVYPNDILQP